MLYIELVSDWGAAGRRAAGGQVAAEREHVWEAFQKMARNSVGALDEWLSDHLGRRREEITDQGICRPKHKQVPDRMSDPGGAQVRR